MNDGNHSPEQLSHLSSPTHAYTLGEQIRRVILPDKPTVPPDGFSVHIEKTVDNITRGILGLPQKRDIPEMLQTRYDRVRQAIEEIMRID